LDETYRRSLPKLTTPADLRGADLVRAHLGEADLSEAYLSRVHLYETVFSDTDLTDARGLTSCDHIGPSAIDHRTIARSKSLPLAFLRGVGLPDRLIEYLPSLLGEAIQFYACFISYSSRDKAFAERLHADLQAKGVRCWFAPHDLPIGAKTRPAIDEAIREYDKLLLILSKHSVDSAWVDHEIERGLAKELRTRKTVLFPVRVDDAVESASSTWARELREDRSIGDFTRWRNHDAYQRTFERVLRDLRVEDTAPGS
jgi:TIR domain/Pentapeptide repeats (8 copies)